MALPQAQLGELPKLNMSGYVPAYQNKEDSLMDLIMRGAVAAGTQAAGDLAGSGMRELFAKNYAANAGLDPEKVFISEQQLPAYLQQQTASNSNDRLIAAEASKEQAANERNTLTQLVEYGKMSNDPAVAELIKAKFGIQPPARPENPATKGKAAKGEGKSSGGAWQELTSKAKNPPILSDSPEEMQRKGFLNEATSTIPAVVRGATTYPLQDLFHGYMTSPLGEFLHGTDASRRSTPPEGYGIPTSIDAILRMLGNSATAEDAIRATSEPIGKSKKSR